MKSIGGYFELECGTAEPYHEGIYLNSARNALRFILRREKCAVVYVPKYTCPVVYDALKAEKVDIVEYELDISFLPKEKISKDAYLIYNNYFGCLGARVHELAEKFKNLIVDNAQAFYSQPIGLAAFYSPRKFFGLPDGGIVTFTGKNLSRDEEVLEQDVSCERMSHLLKRIDYTPEAGYKEFKENSCALEYAPIRKMSRLTLRLMGNINYMNIAKKRWENFNYLHERLHSSFPFAMAENDVPMVYPLFTEDRTLRQRLIDNKIFVARYWPNVEEQNNFADRILPLPIDQRYNLEDMGRICEVIKNA